MVRNICGGQVLTVCTSGLGIRRPSLSIHYAPAAGGSVHQPHHRIVDHARSDARAEAVSNSEKQGIEQADGSYGQPGDGWMVDGKENRIAQQCLPTSPFTVERTVEQAAKQIDIIANNPIAQKAVELSSSQP